MIDPRVHYVGASSTIEQVEEAPAEGETHGH